MGKYLGISQDWKMVRHPVFWESIYVPADYEFYNTPAEREKFRKALSWTGEVSRVFSRQGEKPVALDVFAGAGILTIIYLHFGFEVIAIEKNVSLSSSLLKNVQKAGAVVYTDDNLNVLAKIESNHPKIKLIDLDPYDSCLPQIGEAVRILRNGFLFITAGDIYAGARFKSWQFTERRYGVRFNGNFEAYPVKVIYPYIAGEAKKLGKSAKLHDFFAFPTICRLCVEIS